MTAEEFFDELTTVASAEKAANSARFFKTGKGQYGEGDQFLGVTVPQVRMLCKAYKHLPLLEVVRLLKHPIHECRLAAVLLLVAKYKKGDSEEKHQIYDIYRKMLKAGYINNWDIIDSSCHKIVGLHLLHKPKDTLYDYAKSSYIWDRRVAIISTFADIAEGSSIASLTVAKILLHDKEDLIQKAVGWTLREVGKRVDRQDLLDFLEQHAHEMPRTMLRYSIEHLDSIQRSYFLHLR